MKQVQIIFLVVFIFITSNTFSQYDSWSKAEVHFKDGSVKTGEAKLPISGTGGPFYSNDKLRFRIADRKPVKLIDAKKIEKIVLKVSYSEKVKGKRIKKNREATIITINKNKKKTKKGFAELIVDGKVKLLKRKVNYTANNRVSIITESLLTRNDDVPIAFNYAALKSFRKRTMEFFSECSILVTKIENKVFKREELIAIVTFYNDNCAK
ncbi:MULTISPECIES: hypothetical protein [unclassified Lacinutrix]